MKTLEERQKGIDNLIKEIEEIKKNKFLTVSDKERIAGKYKACGDIRINLYLDTYVREEQASNTIAEESFSDYEKASVLFDEIHSDRECIYSLMALGNAYKETFLPHMKDKGEKFDDYEDKAKEQYRKCIDLCLRDMDKHTQDYFFVMLEQMNLIARKKVWSNKEGYKPKRAVIFHSLKSAESHQFLHGIYYFAMKSNFELWEYRFGKVMTFDEETKFIGDRLDETCALIFLASDGYSPDRKIIEDEIKSVSEMKTKDDPIIVYAVDLGNEKLIKELKKEVKDIKIISKSNFMDIFADEDIKDIYTCSEKRWELLKPKI